MRKKWNKSIKIMEAKLKDESIGDWLKRTAIKDSGWIKEFEWRRDNEYWIKDSFRISLFVSSFLRENYIEKEEFERLCGFKLDLHGSYDWKLSEIKGLELLLNKKLL